MKHLNLFVACLLLGTTASFISCQKVQNASAEQLATHYGEDEAGAADATAADAGGEPATSSSASSSGESGGGNRFGFGGSDSDAPVQPLYRDNTSYDPGKEKKKLVDHLPSLPGFGRDGNEQLELPESDEKILPPSPPQPAQPDPVVRLGYAQTVPGDSLHVTLPGEYASLGPISIERMDPSGNKLGSPWSRGTQMQIPNPDVPGGKIYFKVP